MSTKIKKMKKLGYGEASRFDSKEMNRRKIRQARWAKHAQRNYF